MPALADAIVERLSFPETVIEGGFSTDASANTVSSFESNQIEDNAEALATYIIDNAATTIPAITGCEGASFDDGSFSDAELDACFATWLPAFGARAYRRSMSEGEARIAEELYGTVRSEQGARPAFGAVMQLFLQAPALLYRSERGEESGRLTRDELASRLSFFLTGGLPDESLHASALTPEEVAAQAERLVHEDAFATVLGEFHRDWLHAYIIGREGRSHALFTPDVQRALSSEVGAYTEWLLRDSDARFETLMTSPRIPIAPELAAIYGVESADGSAAEASGRAGILTLASVTAGFASGDGTESAPILRGAFVRESILCGSTLTLPMNDGLELELEATAHLPTAKGRLTFLEERSDCAGCHSQINPLGLAFENFDALGAYRTQENGENIDASGTLRFGTIDEPFETAGELAVVIAQSEEAQACYATQFYRYAMGRMEIASDACSLARVQQTFIESGGDIRALAVAITQTPAFQNRALEVSP